TEEISLSEETLKAKTNTSGIEVTKVPDATTTKIPGLPQYPMHHYPVVLPCQPYGGVLPIPFHPVLNGMAYFNQYPFTAGITSYPQFLHVSSLTILRYKDQFKEAVFLAFDSPSWKVNGVADHVLRSLLGSQVHYYPIDQYRLAGKDLVKLIKRWPSVISKCVITLTNKLQDSNAEEYAVLGSEVILFIYHGYSLKKAINELFVKYNIQFSGVSKSFFRISDKDNHACGLRFSDLVSQVGSMSFDSTGLHWRYNLMANRVLLLLALASQNHPNSSTRLLSETAGHFLKNLKSQLPQIRILAISALNTLLKKSPYKLSPGEKSAVLEDLQGNAKSSLEEALTHTFQEEGFFNETLNSLSYVHIISDSESASRGGHGGHK
ncbi:hypothetical protein S245_020504, partial [Arachis hypogaea]